MTKKNVLLKPTKMCQISNSETPEEFLKRKILDDNPWYDTSVYPVKKLETVTIEDALSAVELARKQESKIAFEIYEEQILPNKIAEAEERSRKEGEQKRFDKEIKLLDNALRESEKEIEARVRQEERERWWPEDALFSCPKCHVPFYTTEECTHHSKQSKHYGNYNTTFRKENLKIFMTEIEARVRQETAKELIEAIEAKGGDAFDDQIVLDQKDIDEIKACFLNKKEIEEEKHE